jgi:PAS domain S-box-containing protein
MQRFGSDKRAGSSAESDVRLAEEITSHAIFVLDEGGTITDWSGPAKTLYGYDAATICGQHLRALLADQDRKGADGPPETFLDAGAEGPIEVEHWHERADGSVFWGTLSLSHRRDDEFPGYVAVCQDTTVSKEYERMLERQNDRLKEFTDILAHDLRNPLNVIDAHLTLYEETDADEHIETIHETTQRMARLLDDLLRVARQGVVVEDPEVTDIEEVVETAWAGTGNTGGASLTYEPVGSISADPDRLCELFENLFRNSVEHSSTDSRPAAEETVEHGSVGAETADEGVKYWVPDEPPAGDTSDQTVEHRDIDDPFSTGLSTGNDDPSHSGIRVSVGPLEDGFYVEDNGPGIPADLRDDVFDHGFTTASDGSGYGLSVVRTIVNAHGWDIVVREADSGGARFEIRQIEFLD